MFHCTLQADVMCAVTADREKYKHLCSYIWEQRCSLYCTCQHFLHMSFCFRVLFWQIRLTEKNSVKKQYPLHSSASLLSASWCRVIHNGPKNQYACIHNFYFNKYMINKKKLTSHVALSGLLCDSPTDVILCTSRVPCLSASLYYTNREQKLETLGLGLESDNVN